MFNFKQDGATYLIGMTAISNSSFENLVFTNILLESVIESRMATFTMKNSEFTHDDELNVEL